jgi:oligopeptide transport system ATP-binding protein
MNKNNRKQTREKIELCPKQDQMVVVENLQKKFPVYEGVLQRKSAEIPAVDNVTFNIPKGTTFGLVGESGSGKTTLGKTILRILEPTGGTIKINNTDVLDLNGRDLKEFRKNAQIVFQDPTSSLNPRQRVKDIIEAPLKIHNYGDSSERLERTEELLDIVDLPRDFLYKYPRSLSGGQKQRVGIARAIALNPDFLVLDEPTSALDVSVQAKIIELLNDLQKRLGLTYLFITHDLSVLSDLADWIGVMYLGQLVEVGQIDSVYTDPHHPYTRALISAIPTVAKEDELMKPTKLSLDGEIPDPRERPSGCSLRSRCPKEFEPCDNKEPILMKVGEGHFSRCYLHDKNHRPDGPEF